MAIAPPPASEIYATLIGSVDAAMVQRVFAAGPIAVNGGAKKLHLLIHSPGGAVADGIALYNYLLNLPLEIITCNAGTVSSIAAIIYLSGKLRKVSKAATFMIHKSTFTFTAPTTADRLKTSAEGLLIDDRRCEMILREHLHLTPERWEIHQRGELTLTAEEGVEFGLAHEIGDWAPPPGAPLAAI